MGAATVGDSATVREAFQLSETRRPNKWRLILQDLKEFRKSFYILLAPLVLSPILFVGTREARCCFTILLMSAYWVLEIAPLAVVAFLPVFLLPALAVAPVKMVASAYINDTNFLFISSLLMALAVEECGLHKRIALKMLSKVGAKPHWLMAGFMIITSFISLWISDTATAALMAPIAYALLEAIMIERMQPLPDVILEQYGREGDHEKRLDVRRLSARDRGICKCVMLLVAHASLIGGTGTINSTGPNLIFRATIEKYYPDEPHGITYLSWIAFAFPPMLLYMFSSWFLVQLVFIGPRHLVSIWREPPEEQRHEEKIVRAAVTKAYNDLGPLKFSEKSVLVFFLLMVGLWMSSDPRVVPGWVHLFKKDYMSDAASGMLIAVCLFLWPNEPPELFFLRKDSDSPPRRRDSLLNWDIVRKRFPWSIILLLGAGFAISVSVKESGLSTWISCRMLSWLEGLPLFVMQIFISVLVVVLTEFSTNSATASIFIPIAFNTVTFFVINKLLRPRPSALIHYTSRFRLQSGDSLDPTQMSFSPSFSFMLPMATTANAIVYETQTMSMGDMACCGLLLNICCVAITVLNMNTWAYWLFDMSTFPEYVFRHNNTLPCF